MLRSGLYDYSHPYILVKKTIKIANTETAENPDKRNKKINLQKIMLL